MWEFPGGRVEEGETDVQALAREVRHRLGAEMDIGKLISFASHPYDHYVVDLFLYECRLKSNALSARNVNAYKWGSSVEFRFQHPQAGPFLLKFMDDIEHVPGSSPKSIQFDHDQLIPGPNEIDNGGQFVATIPRGTGHLLGPDNVATGRLQKRRTR